MHLSGEFASITKKMNSLTKFSPEWTLSKVELKFVGEELEHLYAESSRNKKKESSSPPKEVDARYYSYPVLSQNE